MSDVADILVIVPWPRYPMTTPGGKESKSKKAGQLIPWLSANVVNNLAKPVYRQAVAMWRDAAEAAAREQVVWDTEDHRYFVFARLYRATSHVTDSFSVLEGIKPAVDGLVIAGVLLDDRPENVAGGVAWSLKAESREHCRLELRLKPMVAS